MDGTLGKRMEMFLSKNLFFLNHRLIAPSALFCLVCLQVYQLQTELQKASMENEYQKRQSIRCASTPATPQLQEEVRTLRCQLAKAEKLNPVRIIYNLIILCY